MGAAGNRAGGTTFGAPPLVRGTLEQGFRIYRSLTTPLHRAAFMDSAEAEERGIRLRLFVDRWIVPLRVV